MRILALTNLYPNPWQPGRAPFNRQQLRALAALHELRVIAPIAWTDEISSRFRGSSALPSNRRVIFDGIKVDHPRYLFPPKILRSTYGRCFRNSIQHSFERALDEFQPDIIYATWAYPDGWAAVELGHQAGLPVVIRVHGSDISMADNHPGRKRWTGETLRRADAVVAPSTDLATRLTELGINPARVHVVRNGVDATMFHPCSRSDARDRLGLSQTTSIALFVGNLVPVKGIDFLIGACVKLHAEKARFECHIIGEGPLNSQLERQIQHHGLTDCVKLLGSKPHDELPDWYRAANVLVLPSHSEGLPNVLLEAAACGTRLVASRVGGIPEIVNERNGRLVSPGDVASLAEAMGQELNANSVELSSPPRSFDDSAVELASILEAVVKAHRPANQNAIGGRAVLSMESK